MKTIGHWIDGRETVDALGRTAPIYDPATGRCEAAVHLASRDDVDNAIAIARPAADEWRRASLARRTAVLFRVRELLHDNSGDLARIIARENGKVVSDAAGEVARGLENVEYACGITSLLRGGFTEQASTGVDVYSIRQPIGVVAGITPFNFPAMVPLWMMSNAIACGNAFILKPSEKVPSASMFIAELWQWAGLPDGCLTVLHGDKVAVDRILEHPDVGAVSFVGSTPVARHVYETGTRNGKRVQALGGAKNHLLVMGDADLDGAADAIVSAAYGAAGQRCMAVSVVLAVDQVADQLVERINERIAAIRVGPGSDPATEMGPLITAEHRDRIASYISGAANAGATIVTDGRVGVPDGDGFYLRPTLIDRVQPGMACYDNEIFGPVLAMVRVNSYEEGLRLINDNPYGNGAAIFTRDGGVARQFQFDVQAGMVGINVPIPVPVGYYSFGGWKSSLFGDLHMYGPEGINFYTRGKVVSARWPEENSSRVDLGFPQNS